MLIAAPLLAQAGSQFTIAGEAGVGAASVREVRRGVEAGLRRLRTHFPGTPNRSFAVVVHRSAASLADEIRTWMHAGAPGVALLERQQIHLILDEVERGGSADLQPVVEHELVHILLHQYAGPGAASIPRWFHEGLAQDLSGARYLGAREEDLIGPARFGRLQSFGSLRVDFPRRDRFRLRQAYAQSFSFVAYLRRQLGDPPLLEAARACGDGLPFRQAFVERIGRSIVSFEEGWIEYLKNESGAAERVVLRNCFSLAMILIGPLLVLAVIRKLASDRRAREKLLAEEPAEEGPDR